MGVTRIDTLTLSTSSSVTATAGGGQANAFLLGASNAPDSSGQVGIFEVDTVATAADSVRLPPSDGSSFSVPLGTTIKVINNGANAMQVFGTGADTINGVAAATGVSHPAGKAAEYVLASRVNGVGKWFRNLSA